MRVLVVDDDAVVGGLLQIIGTRAGMAVDKASDGLDALEKLRSDSYDLLMLDLMMPRVSGYDILRHLEVQPRCPRVVVVTAAGDAQLAALNSPLVNCVIRKPFNVGAITEILNALAA